MTAAVKLFITFMLISTLIFGQSKVKMGFNTGPSLTTLKGNAFFDTSKPTIGYRAGLFVQYDFTELIALKTNLAFSNKSTIQKIEFADEFGEFTGPIKTRINYNYVILPGDGITCTTARQAYFTQAQRAQGVSLPVARPDRRASQPGVGH